jgi:DNA-binding transcriptional ArsR family regulator
MTAVEKCRDYLSTHKKPVTVQQLADYFLLSWSSIRHALLQLEQNNEAEATIIGQRQYWSIQRERPMAVSAEAAAAKRPVVPGTSYPHVRGYDD